MLFSCRVYFLKYLCVMTLLLAINPAFAFFEESTFLKAKEAYASKNVELLNQSIATLKSKNYLLTPYAEYWAMLLRLEQADDIEVMGFLETYQRYPFTNRLRGEWLKKLAKQENWALFGEQYAKYQADAFQGEDVALQCEYQRMQAELTGAMDTHKMRKIWLTSQDQPSQCDRAFELAMQSGNITAENLYQRLRIALLEGKPALAKAIVGQLSNTGPAQIKWVDFASKQPAKFLTQQQVSFKTPLGATLNLYALDRLARDDPDKAADQLGKVQHLFDAEYKGLAWHRVGYHAARALNPNALVYFEHAKKLRELPDYLIDTNVYREEFAWHTRAALRKNNWSEVLSAIEMMSKTQANEAAWRYWKARALKARATKDNDLLTLQEAEGLFTTLAKERHYYGWLAFEELPATIFATTDAAPAATAEEVAQIAALPEIKRAVALQNVDMRWEAKMEWQMATRHMSDQALIAAAAYAFKQKWYDVAILTADSTKQLHYFDLRYPTPYRDLFQYAADDERVDEAWVYGLVRQESRFMDNAKSSVGAAGLMQLMPATAKWAAKHKGLIGYSNAMIHDLRTNIALGTFYMRHTLDLLNGEEVLATAAYNAGPGRAKKWMADTPLEAAIYIESIPFSETRNYVQKVMANAHMYAPRVGAEIKTLKQRLGVIPARVE